jgi:hypothetical protein
MISCKVSEGFEKDETSDVKASRIYINKDSINGKIMARNFLSD